MERRIQLECKVDTIGEVHERRGEVAFGFLKDVAFGNTGWKGFKQAEMDEKGWSAPTSEEHERRAKHGRGTGLHSWSLGDAGRLKCTGLLCKEALHTRSRDLDSSLQLGSHICF